MVEYTYKLSETSSVNLYLIRAISAQIVALAHENVAFGIISTYRTFMIYGQPSVASFFLLSGLLISYSTYRKMNNKNYDFKRYFISRFSRFYPLLILLILFTIIFNLFLADLFPIGRIFIKPYKSVFSLILNFLMLDITNQWTLSIFWWSYMFFGWFVLGKRSTKKPYTYYIILGFFSFIMVLILIIIPIISSVNIFIVSFTSAIKNSSMLFTVWFIGAFISLSLNDVNQRTQKNPANLGINSFDFSTEDMTLFYNYEIKLDTKPKTFLLYPEIYVRFLTFLFIAIAYGFIFVSQTPLDVLFSFSAMFSFFLLISYTQYIHFKYPRKVKKIIKFFATYSFSLYIFCMPLYQIFIPLLRGLCNDTIIFILVHIIVNLICIVIAKLVEENFSNKLNNFLLRIFHLD